MMRSVIGLLIVVLAFLGATASWSAAVDRRVALVIGNASYKSASKLRNPLNDADDVSVALKRVGFRVTDGCDLDWHGMRGASCLRISNERKPASARRPKSWRSGSAPNEYTPPAVDAPLGGTVQSGHDEARRQQMEREAERGKVERERLAAQVKGFEAEKPRLGGERAKLERIMAERLARIRT